MVKSDTTKNYLDKTVLDTKFKKLVIDIYKAEDELDKLYDNTQEVKEELSSMRHKHSLMKIYMGKIAETNEHITLLDLLRDLYRHR